MNNARIMHASKTTELSMGVNAAMTKDSSSTMTSSQTIDTFPRHRPYSPATPPPTSQNFQSTTITMSGTQLFSDLESGEGLSDGRSGPELTPPTTPTASKRQDQDSIPQVAEPALKPSSLPTEPLLCSRRLELHDPLGSGKWSIVREATSVYADRIPSEETGRKHSQGLVFAVKVPAHSHCNQVILHEAKVLTFLSSLPQASEYIVPFHGFLSESNSVVMSAMPLSLEEYMNCFVSTREGNKSRNAKSNPIMGTTSWLRISLHLVKGLSWLHSHGIVHGDIRPPNFLLSSLEDPVPVFCDFSGARLIHTPTEPDVPSKNDITSQTYLSPELSKSLVRGGMPTFASDVFALAVSLVAVAIGEEPYAFEKNEYRRRYMMSIGDVLSMVRNGPHFMRVSKGGIVDRAVGGALEKVDKNSDARWTAPEWVEVLETMVEREC